VAAFKQNCFVKFVYLNLFSVNKEKNLEPGTSYPITIPRRVRVNTEGNNLCDTVLLFLRLKSEQQCFLNRRAEKFAANLMPCPHMAGD
jgi:hypothetical protein